MMTYVSSVRYVDGPERISRSSSNNIPIFRIFLSLDLPIGELWPVTQPGGGKAGNSKGQDGSTAIAIDRQL